MVTKQTSQQDRDETNGDTMQAKLMSDAQQNALATMEKLALMQAAWRDTMLDLGHGAMSFASERLREDIATQHAMLRCQTPAELQSVQADFLRKAATQYAEEADRLVGLSQQLLQVATQAFAIDTATAGKRT